MVIRNVFSAAPDAITAVESVKVVINDVAGIDVNMGCPKSFSYVL